ncbi:MAG: low-specificity L-threonine aldolase [Polyangiaceae bacterium UTPRO1]|jgi:threonine aldolase|nr:low-specificity L-threonine aldolase [Myxococcales bacterium]OQY65435.1 MAG: low-specificity L-threonine aldolase [Polyangiaceae bacterium UTPRO1]
MRIVDLRSDTLTLPTAAMRAAMAAAEVGDDVFHEDPTVNALEEHAAGLAGKEAALFLPSGTMANLVACKLHTQPGDEVILERTSHLYRYEAGGFAAYAGVSVALIDGERGLVTPEQVDAAVRLADVHQPRSRLLWLEDTHNAGGGSCWPLDRLAAVVAAGRGHGLAVHLDGARVWNACIAQGFPLKAIADHVDTLSFCFSKGLGCPVGSVLIGDREFIAAARRVRKQLGGGMRQAGILAAAALHALDHHIARLADDHANARRLADGLDGLAGLRVRRPVETNIVLLDTSASLLGPMEVVGSLIGAGVRCLPINATTVRLVTHLDVSQPDVEHALAVARTALESPAR